MTESENSLSIINGLPDRINYNGKYYNIVIEKLNGFTIYYNRIVSFEKPLFKVQAKTIEQAALEMHEILIENNLYK